MNLQVLQTFADSIKIKLNEENIIAILGINKMIYKSDPKEDVINRPVETPKDFDWNAAQGLYLLGRDAMDGKLFPEAEEKLKAALEKDANYLPALIKMSEIVIPQHALRRSAGNQQARAFH